MRDEQKVFQLLGETSASIFPLAQGITGPLFEEHFTERRFYAPTFTAYNVSPKTLSANLICKRTPYTNPDLIESLLADSVEAGYLVPDGKGEYLVSEKGTAAIEAVHVAFYGQINKANQFPEDKLRKLAALLSKLVIACHDANFKTGTIGLEITHHGHPKADNGTLAQIDQLLDDLNAFRDDAHIAAWTPVGVDGHTWEVLTFVWNGEANTAEKLAERLPFRNYSIDDFTKTLENLAERGWIESGVDGYSITKEGRNIREDVEELTNANYLDPWKSLSDEEVAQLEELLAALKETNQKIAEELESE